MFWGQRVKKVNFFGGKKCTLRENLGYPYEFAYRWKKSSGCPRTWGLVGCRSYKHSRQVSRHSPLIFTSLVRHRLLHFHLSHMAVHHLHHLHLSVFHSLNLRLGSSANPFLRRFFAFLPDWFHGLSGHLIFLFCSAAGFVCMVCWLCRLSVCFRTHFKSMHFQFQFRHLMPP